MTRRPRGREAGTERSRRRRASRRPSSCGTLREPQEPTDKRAGTPFPCRPPSSDRDQWSRPYKGRREASSQGAFGVLYLGFEERARLEDRRVRPCRERDEKNRFLLHGPEPLLPDQGALHRRGGHPGDTVTGARRGEHRRASLSPKGAGEPRGEGAAT